MTQQKTRKKICVNSDIQGQIVGRLAKYWILYHLGFWSILFAVEFFRQIIVGFLVGPKASLGDFFANFLREHWLVLSVPIILLPVILRDMLHLTHKVAGPLVRFRNALRQLAAGQPVERIKLRQGDLLMEFQEAFNEFLDSDRLRNDQSLKAGRTSESHSQEDAILDDVAMLDAELHDAKRQSSLTAIH